MTAGVSSDYMRLDDGRFFYNYTARCVVEGTFSALGLGNDNPFSTDYFNYLFFKDCILLAGNCNFLSDGDSLTIRSFPGLTGFSHHLYDPYSERNYVMHITDNAYHTDFVKTLTPGNRYVFVFRFEPLAPSMPNILGDFISEHLCSAIWSVEGESYNYLEKASFAPLLELIEITNSDAHTFDVVYTEDMNAIMRFSEGDMMIVDGRALTKEDANSAAAYCVISTSVADAYSIGVGDTITLMLGTELFEQYIGLGAVSSAPERYVHPVVPIELEIIGTYTDTDSANRRKDAPNWNYSINTVFVPKSLFPLDESSLHDHVFSPSEFSFVLGSAWDSVAFLSETAPLFEELGLRLMFNDRGWSAIADSFRKAEVLSFINIMISIVALFVTNGFIVYLYIGQKRLEYAIMRALGTSITQSARTLLLPLMLVTVFSVLLGNGGAWIRVRTTISQNRSNDVLTGLYVNRSIPIGTVMGCLSGQIALMLLIALAMLRRIGKEPPLALLHGGRQKTLFLQSLEAMDRQSGKKSSTHRDRSATGLQAAETRSGMRESIPVPAEARTSQLPQPEARATSEVTKILQILKPVTHEQYIQVPHSASSIRFVVRYSWRHICRTAWRSVLSAAAAALLFFAFSQFVLMRQSLSEVFTNTPIIARFSGGLAISSAALIAKSEYVSDSYYEATGNIYADSALTKLVITNSISRYTSEELEVVYLEGYDESFMLNPQEIVVVGRSLLEAIELNLGDGLWLTHPDVYSDVLRSYVPGYVSETLDTDLAFEEYLNLYRDQVSQTLRTVSRRYLIVGIVSTPSGNYDSIVFSPGTKYADSIGAPMKTDTAEFTIADNSRVEGLRGYFKAAFGMSAIGSTSLIIDTSKIENINNILYFLSSLYPIVFTAALLIGAFACFLIVLQSSKEAAIMRIQGTTKKKTCLLLSLEHVVLAVTGLFFGYILTILLNGVDTDMIIGEIALFALLYCATILVAATTCSMLVTRRSVLDLLKTKV